MTARWQPTENCRYETLGAETASSRGIQVTADAAANTKGSWTDIGSATSFDYHVLWVFAGSAGSSGNNDYVYDIGINVGGNRWVLAADLRCAALKGNRHGGHGVLLPLYVPAGAQLSIRTAASTGSTVLQILLVGASAGLGGMPGYSRMVAFYTPATSRGVELDPTVAHTKTSYVEITSGTSAQAEAVMFAFGSGGEVVRSQSSNYLVDLASGAGAAEFNFLANIQLSVDAASDSPFPSWVGPLAMNLPASTRLATRCQTSSVTAGERKLDVAAYGFIA